jgi:hypothetical protein
MSNVATAIASEVGSAPILVGMSRSERAHTIKTMYGKHVETVLREHGDSSTIFQELLLMMPDDSTLAGDTFKRLIAAEQEVIACRHQKILPNGLFFVCLLRTS